MSILSVLINLFGRGSDWPIKVIPKTTYLQGSRIPTTDVRPILSTPPKAQESIPVRYPKRVVGRKLITQSAPVISRPATQDPYPAMVPSYHEYHLPIGSNISAIRRDVDDDEQRRIDTPGLVDVPQHNYCEPSSYDSGSSYDPSPSYCDYGSTSYDSGSYDSGSSFDSGSSASSDW